MHRRLITIKRPTLSKQALAANVFNVGCIRVLVLTAQRLKRAA